MRRIVSAFFVVAFALGFLLSPAPASAADQAEIAKELKRQLNENGSLAVRPSTQREFYLKFTSQAELDRLTTVWPVETWSRKFREEKVEYYAPIFLVISDLEPEFNADASRATFRWDAVPDAPKGSSIAVAGTITLMREGTRWCLADRVSDVDLENYRRDAKLAPEDEQALAKLIDESVRLLRAKNDVEHMKLTMIPQFLQGMMNAPGGLENFAKQIRATGGDHTLKRYEALQGKKLYGYVADKLAGLETTDAQGDPVGVIFVKVDGRWYENLGGLKVPNLAAAGVAPPAGMPAPPSTASTPSTPAPSTAIPPTRTSSIGNIPTARPGFEPRTGFEPSNGRPGQSGLPSTGRPTVGRDNMPGRDGIAGRGPGSGRESSSRYAPSGAGAGGPSGSRPTSILPPSTTPRTGTARGETVRPETSRPETARSETSRTQKPLPADAPKIDDLPLPLASGEVDFKTKFERIEYDSTSDVDTVCDAITAALEKQGWETLGRDSSGKLSRIMRRKKGEATLTYQIHKKGDKGTGISIGTKGFDWSGK